MGVGVCVSCSSPLLFFAITFVLFSCCCFFWLRSLPPKKENDAFGFSVVDGENCIFNASLMPVNSQPFKAKVDDA